MNTTWICNNYRIVPVGIDKFEIQEPYQAATWHGLWTNTEWKRAEYGFSQTKYESVEQALGELNELRKTLDKNKEEEAIELYRKATFQPVYFCMRDYK